MYSGETANKMVKNMVAGYKEKIEKLEEENEFLRNENEKLIRKCVEQHQEKSQIKNKSLKTEIKKLTETISQLKYENSCLQSELDALSEVIAQLRKKNKKDDEDDVWVKETISSFNLGFETEVRINKCYGSRTGEVYIDARKYCHGYPTRKGICLSVDDFDTLLRHGRTAWAKIISGLK